MNGLSTSDEARHLVLLDKTVGYSAPSNLHDLLGLQMNVEELEDVRFTSNLLLHCDGEKCNYSVLDVIHEPVDDSGGQNGDTASNSK